MRRAFADFSPAVPVAFAAGLGVSLWIFLLPGGVVQKGPTPVLPALGSAAGRVVADLPVPVGRGASEVRAAVPAQPKLVVALRPPAATARQVHRRARTGFVRRTSSAPVRVVAPPAARAPVTRSWLFSASPKAKGKARGHASEPKADTPTRHTSGHGNGLGRSNEDEGADRLPPGQAKKASAASAPALTAPPKGNRGGDGGKGNGGGNADKGRNGDGNGRKVGWDK